jgi:N-acetyl-gamma-glutamylphosphate reductase
MWPANSCACWPGIRSSALAPCLGQPRGTAGRRRLPEPRAAAWPDTRFCDEAGLEAAVRDGRVRALFCAAPHGAAAARIDALLDRRRGRRAAHRGGCSADFRFRDAAAYQAVYGHPASLPAAPRRVRLRGAGAPRRLPAPHVGTRAASSPPCCSASCRCSRGRPGRAGVLRLGRDRQHRRGRKLGETTHHPERHGNMFAYQPLVHRHRPEIEQLAAEAAAPCKVHFVPHSGAWARGIHATIHGRLAAGADAADLRAALSRGLRRLALRRGVGTPPRIKDVAGSNRARLAVAADGEAFVVMSVIDNLVKGAAGGALQWMNRLLELPEDAGLRLPGPAWT